jgi:alanyl-tRNA synthetase
MAAPTSSQIRQTFIDYFKKQGHTHVGSSSLIPENDPTLLFANAGMNQFKNAFLGFEKRDYTRAVSSQKCVRAGGKHNDLDNVGFTARHHTFFEMLGNFSFGDYFKKDAIHFAWELLTKEYQIPKEKLYVTVFETDDEAADIWHKQEGIPRDRIFRFGEKDNFWRMGDVGPCGPCTEIFYDHGPKAGKESDPYKGILAGEDRFIEIWNLVFMQFDEKSPGVLEKLPKPSVDTGSGLERVVAALQGHYNNYDTDLFSPMIQTASRLSGVEYVKDLDILRSRPEVAQQTAALRVLADHCRSVGFLIADGALPSNEGRGYVLRRILRRGIRYGRKLNEQKSILPEMVDSLIDHMKDFYPELQQRRDHILSTVRDEESRFITTLDQGTEILNHEISKLKSKNQKHIPGELVFKLYDTYGFPVDLTEVMAAESGLSVDHKDFEKHMDDARTKAKASWKGQAIAGSEGHLITWSQNILQKNKATQFVGYDQLANTATILGLSDGKSEVTELKAGQQGFAILNQTSFYAEGGGQVGDTGYFNLETNKGPWSKKSAIAIVEDTIKKNEIFIHAIQAQESLQVGQKIIASVESSSRRHSMANHSATHLMHAALKKVLGSHVGQAGSVVDTERLRFDFTHNKPMTADEIKKVEDLVNEQISLQVPVHASIMKHKDAIASGAVAMFGEKYGDDVRVLRMGDFSCELCGGTHVSNTSQIRVFKIVSEGGVSAGVRRIEALTGDRAVQYLLQNETENIHAREALGLNTGFSHILTNQNLEVTSSIDSLKEKIKHLEKEIRKAQSGQVDVNSLAAKAEQFKTAQGQGQLCLVDLQIEDREVLAQITDQIKNKIESGVVVVVGKGEGTSPIIVSVSKNLAGQIKAGDILKLVAGTMGGKGGGRPDFAQGAAPQREKINEAFTALRTQLQIN